MKSKTVLLTGATGFLGSHLAEDLTASNYTVLALIRNNSDLSRLNEFKNNNLISINADSKNHKELILQHQPSFLIHTSWQSVSAKGRDDWNIQVENVGLTTKILTLAYESGIKRVISFGSQAEYGNFHGRIKDDAYCNPQSAYGAAKFATLNILKSFCESKNINWFWFRLFSLYGTREGNEWLIPSVIHNVYKNSPMNLTGCEQRYDYIYTKDFTKAIMKVLETKSDSGIFNLTSNSSIQIKDIIEKIRNLVNPNAILNIGALPYRPNQVMHMEGNSTKFNKQFNFVIESNFNENLKEIVNYYLAKFKSKT